MFNCVLTRSESDFYPFALVISMWDYISGRFIGTQIVLLVLHVQVA
jgi:hypothetical protein